MKREWETVDRTYSLHLHTHNDREVNDVEQTEEEKKIQNAHTHRSGRRKIIKT